MLKSVPGGWSALTKTSYLCKHSTYIYMVKIGVLGAGHLGKIHLSLIKQIKELELVGFYDPDQHVAQKVAAEMGIKSYASIDELIDDCEAIDIVTPTITHFDCGVKALKKSRHVFIEKPLAHTLKEAKKLLSLANEANVKVQVGHVERFNPAFLAATPYIPKGNGCFGCA